MVMFLSVYAAELVFPVVPVSDTVYCARNGAEDSRRTSESSNALTGLRYEITAFIALSCYGVVLVLLKDLGINTERTEYNTLKDNLLKRIVLIVSIGKL